MTERTRDISLANRVEGLTYDAIAALHGPSVGAVEKHIAKATMRLMQGMQNW